MGITEIGPHYTITVRKKGHLDEIDITVELTDDTMIDDFQGLERLRKDIRHKLKVVLSIDSAIHLVHPRTMARSEGKAQRVIDLRK